MDRVGDWRVQLLLLEAHEGCGQLRFGSIKQTGLCVVMGASGPLGGLMRYVKCEGANV